MQEEGNKPCQDHSKVSKFHELFASSIHVTGWESRCVTVSIRTNHHHHRWILHKNSFFQNKFQINKLMRIQVDWRMESKVMMKREKVRIDSVDLWTMEVRVKELEKGQVSRKSCVSKVRSSLSLSLSVVQEACSSLSIVQEACGWENSQGKSSNSGWRFPLLSLHSYFHSFSSSLEWPGINQLSVSESDSDIEDWALDPGTEEEEEEEGKYQTWIAQSESMFQEWTFA